jgi:transposase InsO family protein
MRRSSSSSGAAPVEREAIPALTRSALHRCLVRRGISRLPRDEERASKRQRFAETSIGYVHIDVRGLRLTEGKLFMSLAIDRVSKFAHVAFYDANTKANGAALLREVVAASPYRIHTLLTDNGMAFADLPKHRGGPTARWMGHIPTARWMGHIFDRVCREHGIEHRLTKPDHPWTNGQAERMNRTVKEATVRAFHYPNLDALRAHVLAFVSAYNFAKHLKALRWRTPSRRSATPGRRIPTSSRSARTTSSRDRTGRRAGAARARRAAPRLGPGAGRSRAGARASQTAQALVP